MGLVADHGQWPTPESSVTRRDKRTLTDKPLQAPRPEARLLTPRAGPGQLQTSPSVRCPHDHSPQPHPALTAVSLSPAPAGILSFWQDGYPNSSHTKGSKSDHTALLWGRP